MGQAFTPGLTAVARTKLRRRRELPLPGKILKQVGDRVSADDVVARAELPGDMLLIRIPEELGITAEEVAKGLCVREGDQVAAGQIVCEHKGLFGLFRSLSQSPYTGTVEIVSVRTGHIGIRLPAKPIEVKAYIGGQVVEVEGDSAVTIEAESGFVQGIFGIGGERNGRIRLLTIAPDRAIRESDLPDNLSGAILVGGTRPDEAVLRKAAALGVQGMIVGSIDDQALAGYLGYDLGIALTGDELVPMSVIITEGFGHLPISERVLTLFSAWDGRPASLNGATQVRAGAIRPEVIVELEAGVIATSAATSGRELRVGSAIRIIRVPYFGVRAEVVELPVAIERIETGAEARVLRAKLEDGQVVTVPRANIELV